MTHDGAGLLEGMPPSFMAARYHSLAVDPATLPAELRVTAMSEVDRVDHGHPPRRPAARGRPVPPRERADAAGPAPARELPPPGRGGRGLAAWTTRPARSRPPAWPSRRGGPMSEPSARPSRRSSTAARSPSTRRGSRWARSWTARRRRPSWRRCSWACGCAARRSTSWPASRRRCASASCGSTRPRARSTSSAPVATAAARSTSRPTSALVVAAAGVPVAKHGNRAITSKAGSADVLDALGVRIDHDAASAGAALREIGFAFLFAPNFHPAMRHAGPTRREIGVRTAFNLLGPLTNPAGTRRQLLGVGDAARGRTVRRGRPSPRARSGRSSSTAPASTSCRSTAAASSTRSPPTASSSARSMPQALGLRRGRDVASSPAAMPTENARFVEAILRGEPGSRRDVVLLNAGAAFLAAGRRSTRSRTASSGRR